MATKDFRAAGRTTIRPSARYTTRHATLDGAVVERGLLWWRRLSPRGRRGWLGCVLLALTLVGGWSVAAAGHVHVAHPANQTVSPLATIGSWLVGLLGVGAYPTLGILGVLGALWLAEGVARRELVGRWLTFALLALWLAFQSGVGLALSGSGGTVGALLDAPFTHAPDVVRGFALFLIALLVMGLALVIGGALAHIIAGGLVMASRALRHLLRRFPDWLRGDTRPAPLSSNASAGRATPQTQRASRGGRQEPVMAPPSLASVPPIQGRQANKQVPQQRYAKHLARGVEAFAVSAEAGHIAHAVQDRRIAHIARIVQQTLSDHGAVTEVYPLAPRGRIIRFCVRPIERLKRDARGQIVADEQGRPVIVRTRVSRIMRLRETLTQELDQELDAPDLRMILPDEDALSDAEAPDDPYVIIEIA